MIPALAHHLQQLHPTATITPYRGSDNIDTICIEHPNNHILIEQFFATHLYISLIPYNTRTHLTTIDLNTPHSIPQLEQLLHQLLQ